MNADLLRLRCSAIVKDTAPRATGNLAFNSIRSFNTPTGFRIVQIANAAPYGSIINTGRGDRALSTKEKRNVGWWERARDTVSEYVYDYYNNNLSSATYNYRGLAKKSRDNPLRHKTFVRSLPKG